MKTKTIAGYEITLEEGTRYYASRPFNHRGRTVYPVSIRSISPTARQLATKPDVVIDGLNYGQAVILTNAFNNGVTSFEGRVW